MQAVLKKESNFASFYKNCDYNLILITIGNKLGKLDIPLMLFRKVHRLVLVSSLDII